MSKAQNWMLSGMQRIEIGDAVNAEDHRFTVEHEPFLPDLPQPRRSTDSGWSSHSRSG
jgi:hypothetical protein